MKTIEIDCRKCINVGENRCILYGNDPKKAIKSCAADKFKNYRIKSLAKMKEVLWMADVLLGLIHQIPLKPEYRSHMFHCPVCRKVVRIGYEERKRNKCDCGQAIDWSEQNEQ